MKLLNFNTNWNQLIQFTKDGIIVADYSDIRNAITTRFKEIYGSDIDLATTSADGIYVETLCMMISNILQSFKHFYSQLDVTTANGKYLDALCALSNVYRKAETHSTCSISLTLDISSISDYTTNDIAVVDKNGNIWSAHDNNSFIFEPGITKTIIVTCEKPGPVRADIGWIINTVATDAVFDVRQNDIAAIGNYAESDSELRARRNSSLGATGNTVLETMIGSLYTINGIDDVKIYNNDTNTSITALDGTSILPHSLYIVLRQQFNVNVDDIVVCNTIYEKLTPGIKTTKSNATFGIAKEAKYLKSFLGTALEDTLLQMTYWKIATPITPKITINLKITTNYGSKDNTTSNIIAKSVISYLNNLQLSSEIYTNDLWNVITCSDPLFRGQPTFRITSIVIDKTDDANKDKNSELFILPDTYFNYIDSDIKIVDTNNSQIPVPTDTISIIIGG